jgi:hypothetical protein
MESLEEPPEGLTPHTGDAKRAKLVRVVEAWHLAMGKKPGRYVICLKNGVNMTDPDDVEYEYDTFPVAFYHADRHLTGPWAQSTTSSIYEMLRMANECVQSMANAESKVPKAAIAFDPAEYEDSDVENLGDFQFLRKKDGNTVAGSEPKVLTPAPFDRMNIEWVNWLIKLIHDVAGMPENATSGTREAGIPSAEGQRLIAALANERFAQSSADYVHWVAVDTAKLAIRAMRRMHARDGSFTRHWLKQPKSDSSSVKFMRAIKSDTLAQLDDDKFVLQPAPVGKIMNTPAERMQSAVDAVSRGIIDPKRLPGIQAHLDTPGEVKGLDGQREWIDDVMDSWLFSELDDVDKPGFYRGPLPQFNVEDATLQVLDGFYAADLEIGNDEEESFRVDFFTQFITELDHIAKQKAQFQASLQQQPAAGPEMMQ